MNEIGAPRLRIEQAGADVLATPSRRVTVEELRSERVQGFIDMLFATLAGTGVGLAAPQVGFGLQIVVIEDPAELQAGVDSALLREQERVPVPPHVLVNPEVEILDASVAEFFEGCLSVNGYRAIVPRARRLRVRALDRLGQPFEAEASGWYARIVQHEVDHLQGVLYVERMLARTFVTAESAQREWTRVPITEAKRRLGVVIA